jgi:hypothetical protein
MRIRTPFSATAFAALMAFAGLAAIGGAQTLPTSCVPALGVFVCPAPSPSPTVKPTIAPTNAPTASPKPSPTASAPPLLFTSTIADPVTVANAFNATGPIFAGCGNLPVTITGALSGKLVQGATVQVYGSFNSATCAVTASVVYVTAAPPTSAPTVAPTAAPTIAGTAPTIDNGGLVNGQPMPVSFVPFAPNGPWHRQLSANPTQLANSAAIIAIMFPGGTNSNAFRSNEVGLYDYNASWVFSKASDPLVTVACTGYCDKTDHGGYPAQIHIPAKARVPGAWNGGTGDRQWEIVQPGPGYQAVDLAYVTQPSGDWGTAGNTTVTSGAAANCGSFYGVNGETGFYGTSTGDTADGNCISAGAVRPNELLAGVINHALKIVLACQGPGVQYPVSSQLSTDFCPDANGAPPLGAPLWYDVPDATTNARTDIALWVKAILNALHDHGGIFGDNSCPVGDGTGHCTTNANGFGIQVESQESQFDFGQPNLWATIPGWTSFPMSPNPGPGDGIRWVGADPFSPANLVSHLHWLAPCALQGTC